MDIQTGRQADSEGWQQQGIRRQTTIGGIQALDRQAEGRLTSQAGR